MDLLEKGFQLPEKINFDSESLTNTYGKLYAEAFERGFGTTVGNALRRVLLSSIEGAAVTSMRVTGVLHEFSNLTGVKEDFVDVVLNVKQLCFKMHSDTPQVATINVKGPVDVTGKDIVGDQVEVLTPNQHILTLGKKSNFSMELTIEKGKGYVTADENKNEDQPVDTIAIDYDKLVMEIWTDGSITPEKAVSQAAGILNEHLSLFSMNGEPDIEEEAATISEEVEDVMPTRESIMSDDFYEEEPMEVNVALLKNVEELELSVRSYNCLKNANILTLADLVQKTEQEMLRTKNFGRKSLNEIKEIIQSMGLNFNMRVDVDELQKMASAKRTENAS